MNDNKKKRLSLSNQILIGLIVGVVTGLFLGDIAGGLAVFGRAYVGLLQMTILPYMIVSLVAGIGGLSYIQAGKLAVTGGIVLIASWALAFLIIFIMPLAFPSVEAGSFYSPSLVEAGEVDFVDLYIPVNPFSSMARTIVPAVAVFSVALGIALIGVDTKNSLLEILNTISKTLTRVANLVVRLAPFGIFAIAANAAGTLSLEEFGRLQAYILTFVVASILLTFVVFPGLVAILTPFSYRDVLKASRAALITGFATGNLFIVLPMLIEGCKELFEKEGVTGEGRNNYIEVLVPTSFAFPNVGKLLTLLFILFAGWFTGKEVGLGDYPMFASLGTFTLFGGVDLALPFLLDQMRIPADMFQLYVMTGVVNSWFATLLAAMNLFAFTLIATCAAMGLLRFSWPRLARFAGVTAAVFLLSIVATRLGLGVVIGDTDLTRETLMQATISETADADVYDGLPDTLVPGDMRANRLQQIRNRGTLRVGYNPDNLPFSFFNDGGELVGFDVELLHILARELEVKLEFIPWSYGNLYSRLNDGEVDIAIGGLIFNVERRSYLAFSEPYMKVTPALVVMDHRRNEFERWQSVGTDKPVRLGITGQSRAETAQEMLPEGTVVRIDRYEPFFTENPDNLDGIIISAEAGSAWTILHPDYSLTIPEPQHSGSIGFMMAKGDLDFVTLVSDYLDLKIIDGTVDRLYKKWILGVDETRRKPRWSIGRDVLGWFE